MTTRTGLAAVEDSGAADRLEAPAASSDPRWGLHFLADVSGRRGPADLGRCSYRERLGGASHPIRLSLRPTLNNLVTGSA